MSTIMKKFIDFVYPEDAKVNKQEYERRVSICSGCHIRKQKTNSCGKLLLGSTVRYRGKVYHTCGCVVDAMAVLKDEDCKLGRWKENV